MAGSLETGWVRSVDSVGVGAGAGAGVNGGYQPR